MEAESSEQPQILHVTQPTDGGTAAVVMALMARQASEGYAVRLICPVGDLARWSQAEGFDTVILPMGRAPSPRDWRTVWRLRQEVLGADVVHLHSSKAGALGRMAVALLRRRQRPVCLFTPHGWSWYTGGRLCFAYRAWERVAARWATFITATSQREHEDGRAVLSDRHMERVVVIPNGVDPASYSEPATEHRGAGRLIVCVGRLCEQKGQEDLLQAFALTAKPRARLRFVGDGPDRALLEATARGLHITDDIEWVGAQDPRGHYMAADLVVLPSRWEGLPLVLLEAMASGAAVVASTAGSAGVLDDVTGVVYDSSTGPEGLARVLDALLADPDRCASLGRSARAAVVNNYSLTHMQEGHLRLLENALKGTHAQ